jgi:predicted DNA-binding transcriptional regulator YafY
MAKRYPETQRATRILDIIARICSQPRAWNRARLANDFEVSERQITKDLETIRHGLRLDLKHERGSGYYFDRMPNLPALSFSLPEALAILLSAQAGRRMVGISQEDLSAAMGRLTAIMPAEFVPLISTNSALPPPAGRDKHREAMLSDLFKAIANRRSVNIEYVAASRPDERTERQVDPYAIIPTRQAWHVIGWCHLRRDIRIFKIDRIRSLTVSDETYEPDPEFDVEDFLSAGWGITREPNHEPQDVELIFTGKVSRWIAEENWHPTQRLEWIDAERLRFTLQVPVTEEFGRWVLSSGANCEVVRPDSLRGWIQSEAAAIVGAGEPVRLD